MEESGHMDPAFLGPPKDIADIDDNHDLDFDAGSACDESDDAFDDSPRPFNVKDLISSDLWDMELLTACVDSIDPASRALYNMTCKINNLCLDGSSVYAMLDADYAVQGLRDGVSGTIAARAHVDGGLMASTTHDEQLLHHYTKYPLSWSKSHNTRLAVANKFACCPVGEG
jgi:hypothetical protein